MQTCGAWAECAGSEDSILEMTMLDGSIPRAGHDPSRGWASVTSGL